MVKRTAEHNAKIAKSMKAYHSTCEGVKKADRVVKVKFAKVVKVKAPKVAKKSSKADTLLRNSSAKAVSEFLANLTPAQKKDAEEFEKARKKPRKKAPKKPVAKSSLPFVSPLTHTL